MDLKSFMSTLFILVLLLAVPGSSKEGQDSDVYQIDYRGPRTDPQRPPHSPLRLEEGQDSDVYEIDYRGPETHPQRPPHSPLGNDVLHKNLKKHPGFKKQATKNAIKKGRKLKE